MEQDVNMDVSTSAAPRTAMVERKTRETEILVSVNLDGTGVYDVDTGIGFLDHMLESFSKHSAIDLTKLHRRQSRETAISAIAWH